ncbi:MAG: type II toxin-antitoxin system RelE/ParE family toxin [Dehalococcoidia bacterium]|nr:type II toxin-antitoxin system RelE/ParE family toxin [Dehalococcoidia bacterium]
MQLSPRAERDLAALPREDVRRIAEALAVLKTEPRPRGTRKLRGRSAPAWRLRIGDFRAIFTVSDRARLVVILCILQRREDTYRL